MDLKLHMCCVLFVLFLLVFFFFHLFFFSLLSLSRYYFMSKDHSLFSLLFPYILLFFFPSYVSVFNTSVRAFLGESSFRLYNFLFFLGEDYPPAVQLTVVSVTLVRRSKQGTGRGGEVGEPESNKN